METVERRVTQKLRYRLLPILFLGYLFAYIDRVNAGVAALQMNRDIGLTNSMFGFGGGVFFVAYLLFEIPSNLALQRFGARRWLARIMISWSIASALTALSTGGTSFLIYRFLLGIAEAGFVPGVILYMTYWFPARERGRAIALFMAATPLAGIIGSPLGGAILGLDQVLGIAGWQWLFVLEALPSLVLGVVCLFLLEENPAHVRWLSADEKAWLDATLTNERMSRASQTEASVWGALSQPGVLLLGVVYAGQAAVQAGLGLWQPQILKSFSLTNFEVGLLNAAPSVIAAVGMIVGGLSTDRRGERILHILVPAFVTAVALAALFFVQSLAAVITILGVVAFSISFPRGAFWGFVTERITTRDAVVGIAVINSIGTGASFVTNYTTGALRDHASGGWAISLSPLAALAALAGIAMIGLRHWGHRREDVRCA